jgi:hypothetical protein
MFYDEKLRTFWTALLHSTLTDWQRQPGDLMGLLSYLKNRSTLKNYNYILSFVKIKTVCYFDSNTSFTYKTFMLPTTYDTGFAPNIKEWGYAIKIINKPRQQQHCSYGWHNFSVKNLQTLKM